MRRLVAVALTAGALLASDARASRAAETGLAEVRAAASEYARGERGTLYFQVTTASEMHAGPLNRRDESAAAYVLENGGLAKKRYLSMIENKHELTGPELEKKSTEPEGALTRLGMMVPSRSSAVDDYTYDVPARQGNGTRVGFHTKVHDAAHGDGSLDLDANGKIERLTFTPAVLPEHAQTATVTVTFGEAAPGLWDVTRIERAFSGRRFFVKGTVESVSRYAGYHRYPTVEAGLAALAHASATRT